MKLTISKAGVEFEIEGEEILRELFRDENKCLWELKRALDKLESYDLSEPSEEDIKSTPYLSDEELNKILSPFDLQSSDLKTSPALQFYPPTKEERIKSAKDIKEFRDKIQFIPSDERSFDGGKKTFFEHDEVGHFPRLSQETISEIDDLLNSDKINHKIEENPQSDTKVPPPTKKSISVKKKAKKRKNSKRGKHTRKKVSKFVGKEKPNLPIKNEEDSPIIIPAKRPRSSEVVVNIQ